MAYPFAHVVVTEFSVTPVNVPPVAVVPAPNVYDAQPTARVLCDRKDKMNNATTFSTFHTTNQTLLTMHCLTLARRRSGGWHW